MVTLQKLISYLETYLSTPLFQDYCPNGLQIEGKREIQKIATGVSANIMTIEAAVEMEADALIVHHGLFWNNDPYPIVGTKRKKIELLLKNELSLIAYHLPLDAHQEVGNNWKAARDLGWRELEPFGYFGKLQIGVKGVFDPISPADFLKKLEKYYGGPAVKVLAGRDTIRSAALVSGGAYKELQSAAKEQVDCFITGNFDEPAWNIAHEEKIHFFALGHTATEKIGPKALLSHLNEKFSLSGKFLEVNNPF